MKRIIGITLAAITVIGLSACKNNNEDSYTNIDLTSYVDNLIEKTPSYVPYWNKEKNFKGRWNYIDGVFLQSMIQIYKDTNDAKYKNFVVDFVNYYIDSTGEFQYLGTNPEWSGWTSSEGLDTVCESAILFDLYDMTNDSRYLKAISTSYAGLLNNKRVQGAPNFEHKPRYVDSIFLDGMYMYVPFYAHYANRYGRPEIFDEIKSQYKYINDNMRDPQSGLYFHGHQATKEIFWANKETGNSESVWSRGLGWLAMSLVDSIEYFPDGDNKDYLKVMLEDLLNNLLKCEDKKTHMFYQLTALGKAKYMVPYQPYLSKLNGANYKSDSEISNYLESSGSSMFAYTFMKASRLGYVSEDYYEKGYNMFVGTYRHSYNKKNNVLNDICITAGLGPETSPHRDGSPRYYLAEKVGSDDAKGSGPFLMAYTEYRHYIENKMK